MVSLLLRTMTKCTRGAVVTLGSAPVPSMKLPVMVIMVVVLIMLKDCSVDCADVSNSLKFSLFVKRFN